MVEIQKCRNLSENGVVNGVVKLGRRRQISEYEMNETHVLADAGTWGLFLGGGNKR